MKRKLMLIIAFHHVMIISLVISGFLCLIYEPFYVTLPIIAFIGALGTDLNHSCILTRRENKLRRMLGMKTIQGFVKHYYLRRG